jgi:hypothetical protein
MKKSLTLLLVTCVLLTSCGGWQDSRVNPGNWFGNSKSTPVEPVEVGEVNPLLPRKAVRKQRRPVDDGSVLILNVAELKIEQVPSGAIINALGISARQGAYNVHLRELPVTEDTPKGVVTYEFRLQYPEYETPVGSERQRQVRVAKSISTQDLESIRVIRVTAAQNQRESRRR